MASLPTLPSPCQREAGFPLGSVWGRCGGEESSLRCAWSLCVLDVPLHWRSLSSPAEGKERIFSPVTMARAHFVSARREISAYCMKPPPSPVGNYRQSREIRSALHTAFHLSVLSGSVVRLLSQRKLWTRNRTVEK
ncbi:hypothetical protein KIL84_014109 [Mauremys mutica]|uniref:Uncharacterized protein n=1 Tax=Mauremys mutica TaxID=74926 RepID=A0A9D4B6W6_9SAUR|nr:hypothetical protein KIL84_014109 [Mauremys mutica]